MPESEVLTEEPVRSKTSLARQEARVPPRITLTVLANGYAWEIRPHYRRAFIEYDTAAKGWAWEVSPPRKSVQEVGFRYGRRHSGTCKYLHQALRRVARYANIEPRSADPIAPTTG